MTLSLTALTWPAARLGEAIERLMSREARAE